ncbi:alpha/beta-hydrolase [Laetiporus sulphureus 93-53]|uniref:Alpha/beta-hydrolase n=1 Tax=Laetiporus sulphureus 93-53 TaxID=1314785 RepID=A0A165E9Z7_9APHY|nr:alpha/beta-hydrolase [Laetiporus sulphureus 93-53]KZT06563.1 alpha/beta-hydrolase [Laetiporus sulphureus 93-53]
MRSPRADSSLVQWMLLALPAAVFLAVVVTAFPNAPATRTLHPSLASLPPDSSAREIYPVDYWEGGAYVSLPMGKVRYWLIGPEDGERIVLIHGLSVPAIIWQHVAPQLADAGYRVLLYDLYGRGYSDAPQTTYDTVLYTSQLALLMQHIGWTKAHVVGVSMGGGIAVAFAAQFPQLVSDRLALVACSGLIEPTDLSRTAKFLSSPLMQFFTSSYPFRKYLQHLTSSEPWEDPISELVRVQSAYLPGFNPAVASSLRDGPVRGLSSAYEAIGRRAEEGMRVLLIWGTKDHVVPYATAARVRALVPQAELITIEGAPHGVLLSHAEQVRDALLRFFKGS